MCVAILVLASCGGSDEVSESSVSYPDSIAMLAHSGGTGENSDPGRPGLEVRSNSWATGTNPAVKSLYLRILAENPEIEGSAFNLSQGGATVRDFAVQAEEATTLEPAPELLVIQFMDNDMVCPATADDYNAFGSSFEAALEILEEGLPESRLFVVSQFGRPTTYVKAFTREERRTVGASGPGPCAFIDSDGQVIPRELARLEEVIRGYESQLQAGCERFTNCRYDGGAFGRVVEKPRYFSSDMNHLSVEGLAKMAAVAWASLQRVGLVPR